MRGAPGRAAAVDFLRFLGSKPGMELFSARSNWLPSLEGVSVPAWMEPLRPVQAGYAVVVIAVAVVLSARRRR